MRKNLTKGRITDFFIFLTLFSLAAFAFGFMKSIMYGKEEYLGELSISTLPLSAEYSELVSKEDVMFDAITKRRVGSVKEVEVVRLTDSTVYLKLTLDAQRLPVKNALRSEKIYLEIDEVSLP